MCAVFNYFCEDLSTDIGEGDFNGFFVVFGIIVVIIAAEGGYDKIGEFGYFDWDVEGISFFAHL